MSVWLTGTALAALSGRKVPGFYFEYLTAVCVLVALYLILISVGSIMTNR
jgi:hypothetical protein